MPQHVVVIGAGPAGLAAAVSLRRRGVACTLLERGASILTGLRRIDPAMPLLSPRRLSRLPAMGPPTSTELGARRGRPDRGQARTATYLQFGEFVEALEEYATRHQLDAVTDTEVIRVRRVADGFDIDTRQADGSTSTLSATHVVNCTGITSEPWLPEDFDPAMCRWSWKHSLDARQADLQAARRLLVVGGGASAAEILNLWLDVRGDDERAWLSLRSKLFAFTNPILGLDIHCWIWLPEQARAHWLGRRADRIKEAMNGSRVRPAVRRGLINIVAPVESYDPDAIVLNSGERIEPDLVVFATGFRYRTEHLRGLIDEPSENGRRPVCCCESRRTPGLYLLGYRFGRTFASPYIRGIAKDAEYVARRIARAVSIR